MSGFYLERICSKCGEKVSGNVFPHQCLPPDGDLRPHTESERCKCKPSIEVQKDGTRLVVHNAYDGREFFEDEKKNEQARDWGSADDIEASI